MRSKTDLDMSISGSEVPQPTVAKNGTCPQIAQRSKDMSTSGSEVPQPTVAKEKGHVHK